MVAGAVSDGGTVSFTTLVICPRHPRRRRGTGVCGAAHAVYKWFPDEKRTLPTADPVQGSAFGGSSRCRR